MAVAVAERFKQVSMYGLSAATKKKRPLCREVAVTGGSTVVKYVEKNIDITKGQGNGKIYWL